MESAIETEIKLPVVSTAETVARLRGFGFEVAVPRLLEANTLYDTQAEELRGRRMMLRLRQAGDRFVLTWKGPPEPGPHKARPEIESTLGSIENVDKILRHLGYEPRFRYEKYRTEFHKAGEPGATVTLDETPVGTFLELEGPGDWIDSTAKKLGYTERDYVLDSYGGLYRSFCAERGVTPTHMVFAGTEPVPATVL